MDPNARRRFGTLVAAALVDGVLSEDERLVLHRKATEMSIPTAVMNEILAQKGLSVAVPPTREAKEELLDDLIDVTCADGRLEPPEHHLLAKFASHLGLALPDLRARVRNRMRERNAGTRESARPAPAPPTPVVPEPASLPMPGSPAASVADIPPVTLALLKQAISFEPKDEAVRAVERMLGVPQAEARRIYEAVCSAFPDLKPGVHQIHSRK